MTYLVIILGILALSFLIAVVQTKNEKKEAKEVCQLEEDLKGVYRYYNGTLSLYKQDDRMEKLLKYVPYSTSTYKDVPEKYVYTGATVGGVTTGGVHKTGGYTEATNHSTKRYELKIKEYDYSTGKIKLLPIEKICLCEDELVDKACAHDVREFVTDKTIVVKEDDEVSQASAVLMRMGKGLDAVNSYNLQNIDKYPTLMKCVAIKSFVTGRDMPKTYNETSTVFKVATLFLGCIFIAAIIGVILLLMSLLFAGEIAWPFVSIFSGGCALAIFIYSCFHLDSF